MTELDTETGEVGERLIKYALRDDAARLLEQLALLGPLSEQVAATIEAAIQFGRAIHKAHDHPYTDLGYHAAVIATDRATSTQSVNEERLKLPSGEAFAATLDEGMAAAGGKLDNAKRIIAKEFKCSERTVERAIKKMRKEPL